MNSTGFYRVTKFKKYGYTHLRYLIRNELINRQISRKDIYELKKAVEEAGFLWGITNLERAKEHLQEYELKDLQGRYGIRIEEDDDEENEIEEEEE